MEEGTCALTQRVRSQQMILLTRTYVVDALTSCSTFFVDFVVSPCGTKEWKLFKGFHLKLPHAMWMYFAREAKEEIEEQNTLSLSYYLSLSNSLPLSHFSSAQRKDLPTSSTDDSKHPHTHTHTDRSHFLSLSFFLLWNRHCFHLQ